MRLPALFLALAFPAAFILADEVRDTEKWNTQVAKVVAVGPLAFCDRNTGKRRTIAEARANKAKIDWTGYEPPVPPEPPSEPLSIVIEPAPEDLRTLSLALTLVPLAFFAASRGGECK